MRKFLLLFITILTFGIGNSQVLNPVKWKTKVEKSSDTEFNLIIIGTIDDNWHVYSQFTPDGGPLPMILDFKNKKGNYELIGKAKESKYKKSFNDVFGVDEYLFEKTVIVTQKIKLINLKNSLANLHLEYQVCKDACINDNKDFVFNLPLTTLKTSVSEADTTKTLIDSEPIKSITPEKVETTVKQLDPIKPLIDDKKDKGVLNIFILAFFGGMFATITPCVFPMIPMTVSFFLKQSGKKSKGTFNALFYGLCIVAICVLITIPFHLLEGINRDIFSQISTNVYLNIFFFLIFIIFAISFFGAFEITMPSKIANKVDNASNSKGLIGIFFMALTLIIVSFSCIGPALGFVFGTSLNSDGGAKILSLAMLGFGLGLALPFMFFAIAPNLLGNLPKSGGWLNTVKVIFGFIELALAFKFLSNADLVLQSHFLEREVFIAIWIAIFATMSIYLFGKITLPHDSKLDHISVGRMLFGLITLSFTLYLFPGLFGAPLKLISAFTPPQTYSESPNGIGNASEVSNKLDLPIGATFGPHKIISFEDYKDGVAYAKKINKPILIDFTGRACQNCRLMENNVWSDAAVLKILKNDVVLISLYGDDRKELTKADQYISKENGSLISTVGQKWSEFQIQKFKNNSRPYYVLLNLDEQQLSTPVPYTPNIEEYKKWLLEGIKNFKK